MQYFCVGAQKLQILAKIMFDKADRKPISVPLFQSVANVLAEEMARMNVEELARQLDCSSKIFSSSFGNLLSPLTFIIRGLMVNRMFAVHPIERNHYITLAISFFNDKAFKLHCKDYDK